MAKRRVKKRTHVGAPGLPPKSSNAPQKPGSRSPKSMVIRIGASDVGPSVTQLVRDVRTMMEPDTASRLKERKNNKLRDYTTMAGPLGVTHLLLFSRSEKGSVNFRLAVTPRGPTLWFRVERYSLCKDVYKSQKRPKSGGSEYLAPPLLVMNNFTSTEQEGEESKEGKKVPRHLESLTTTVFQSMFPSINPTNTPLKSIKRVLLLDRLQPSSEGETGSYVLNLRHYAISTRTAKSVPKPLRRLDAAEKLANERKKRSALPNLGKLNDVSDYLLDPHAADGFTSGSDSEPETDAEVEVLAPTAQKVQNHRYNKDKPRERRDGERKPNVEKKGIKLHELGPRLKLRLTKVEEGLCGGKVMWHEYFNKTEQEVREMDKEHEVKRAEKEQRRAEQKANVERKRKERRANGEADGDEELDEVMSDDDEWDDEEEVDGDEEDEEAGAEDEEMDNEDVAG